MSTVQTKPSAMATELAEFIADGRVTQRGVARGIGKSPSLISQYLSGKYPGNTVEIDGAVQALMQRQREKVLRPASSVHFVGTSVAQKVWEAARMVHLECEIGVVCGDAGLGKTIAVREYTRKNPGTILIEADLGYTAKTLFSELHRIVGYDGAGNLHGLLEAVVQKLKDSGRMIIVDEAEHLPYRALEMLRRVYDKANVGILLVGMPRLLVNIKGRRMEYAQLYSRVGVVARLEKLIPSDTQKLVRTIDKSADALHDTYHRCSGGNARVLSKLVSRSLRVADINDVDLSNEVIERTAEMLLI